MLEKKETIKLIPTPLLIKFPLTLTENFFYELIIYQYIIFSFGLLIFSSIHILKHVRNFYSYDNVISYNIKMIAIHYWVHKNINGYIFLLNKMQ